MYCKNCGSSISDDAVICPNCGVQVGELKPSGSVRANESASPKAPNTVGLVGFILAMVGVLFWLIGVVATRVIFIVSILLSIAAIVCSALGMKNAKRNNAGHRGLSIAGLVVGIVVVSISVIQFIIALSVLSAIF